MSMACGLYEGDRPALAEAYGSALWWVLALVCEATAAERKAALMIDTRPDRVVLCRWRL